LLKYLNCSNPTGFFCFHLYVHYKRNSIGQGMYYMQSYRLQSLAMNRIIACKVRAEPYLLMMSHASFRSSQSFSLFIQYKILKKRDKQLFIDLQFRMHKITLNCLKNCVMLKTNGRLLLTEFQLFLL
jgi:hypothetical protein